MRDIAKLIAGFRFFWKTISVSPSSKHWLWRFEKPCEGMRRKISFRVRRGGTLVMLSVATSMDALAVGFPLAMWGSASGSRLW